MRTSRLAHRLMMPVWLLSGQGPAGSSVEPPSSDGSSDDDGAQGHPGNPSETVAVDNGSHSTLSFAASSVVDAQPAPFVEGFALNDLIRSQVQFAVALKTRTVALNQIAELHAMLANPPVGNVGHEADGKLLSAMIESFQERHGEIVDHYYCVYTIGGAVRTKKGGLHITIEPDDPEVVSLITDCERLGQEAEEALEGSDLELVSKRVFSVVRGLLTFLDLRVFQRYAIDEQSINTDPGDPASLAAVQPAEPTTIPTSVEYYREALKHARKYFEEVKRRNIINLYFSAAVVVALVITAVVSVVSALAWSGIVFEKEMISNGNLARDTLLVCLFAGSGGAIISVLERVRRWDLIVIGVPTKRMIVILGAARLLIGAAFALLVYAGIKATLIPIEIPEGAVEVYFWLIVGFIAGFSERFAPDALAVTEGQLSTRTNASARTVEQPNV